MSRDRLEKWWLETEPFIREISVCFQFLGLTGAQGQQADRKPAGTSEQTLEALSELRQRLARGVGKHVPQSPPDVGVSIHWDALLSQLSRPCTDLFAYARQLTSAHADFERFLRAYQQRAEIP